MDFDKLHTELKFTTSRSGGSGGQHVNKVETKVTLRFDIFNSAVLSDAEKQRIITQLKNHINKNDELILHQETDRSQLKNKRKIIKKFNTLISKALKKDKKRVPSKVPKAIKRKRGLNKKHRSELKSSRKKIQL